MGSRRLVDDAYLGRSDETDALWSCADTTPLQASFTAMGISMILLAYSGFGKHIWKVPTKWIIFGFKVRSSRATQVAI